MKEELLHDGIKVAFQWNEYSRQRGVHSFSSTLTVKVIDVMILSIILPFLFAGHVSICLYNGTICS